MLSHIEFPKCDWPKQNGAA